MTEERPIAWSLEKIRGSETAELVLAEEYEDFEGDLLTVLLQSIGETLIKVGTSLLQSRAEYGYEEEYW